MTSPILWQNENKTITLIDVPTSIVFAQGSGYATSHRLLSSAPLQHPFPSNEPKSQSARSKLNAVISGEAIHSRYQDLLQQAIDEVQSQYDADWCLPRLFTEQSKPPAKKRRLDDDANENEPLRGTALPDHYLSNLARQAPDEAQSTKVYLKPNANTEPEPSDQLDDFVNIEGITHSNNSFESVNMHITTAESEGDFIFNIPPNASFFLGDCAKQMPFRKAVCKQAEAHGTRRTFDFILLDPPWPNRSVRRTHKTAGSTYAISASTDDIRDLILDTCLEVLMEDDCLVAIWITNKPAVRELVLGENGVFDCWKVDLVEEWIWLKTTSSGEPIVPLDGVWRKPYEVLLLGRRRTTGSKTSISPEDVLRRVVIGVPDLHSRKPCLKALIEPRMKDSMDYRALEVFARHLVAGWWSWGDECIKFNWDGYWCVKENEEHLYEDTQVQN